MSGESSVLRVAVREAEIAAREAEIKLAVKIAEAKVTFAMRGEIEKFEAKVAAMEARSVRVDALESVVFRLAQRLDEVTRRPDHSALVRAAIDAGQRECECAFDLGPCVTCAPLIAIGRAVVEQAKERL